MMTTRQKKKKSKTRELWYTYHIHDYLFMYCMFGSIFIWNLEPELRGIC